MVDIVDPLTRARMMSGIRGKNTKPELLVRRFLHGLGFRYRLNVRELSGSPDIVLPRFRTCISVHGCFWHRHAGCRLAANPATRRQFWQKKFNENVARDRRARKQLLKEEWQVIEIWECGLRAYGIAGLNWLPTAIRRRRPGNLQWPEQPPEQ